MKVFYSSDEPRQFDNPRKYAFLNWWFDDGYGENNNQYQHIFDNYHLGQSFLGNALLSLNSILETNNMLYVADKLIFPIFFDIWHGLELWIKSSIDALNLLVYQKSTHTTGHEIIDLTKELITILRQNRCDNIIITALGPLNELVTEFERVNAHFDFARYSFDRNHRFQFYNAPYKDRKQWQNTEDQQLKETVPNTCVDIMALFELTINILDHFGAFVEYLSFCISVGGTVSDFDFQKYLKSIHDSEEALKKHDSDKRTIQEYIFREILS